MKTDHLLDDFSAAPFLLIPSAGRLNIEQFGEEVILFWPVDSGDFALEATTDELPTTNWTPVEGTPVIIDGNLVMTNSLSTGAKFYRLKSR